MLRNQPVMARLIFSLDHNHYRYQSWWYNSIIARNYNSMEECQRFCEEDDYCGACDYWYY